MAMPVWFFFALGYAGLAALILVPPLIFAAAFWAAGVASALMGWLGAQAAWVALLWWADRKLDIRP